MAEITRKELDTMRARRSKADVNLVFTWLRDDGEIRVVDEVPVASKDANREVTLTTHGEPKTTVIAGGPTPYVER